MEQKVLWIPESRIVDVVRRPSRVWTLFEDDHSKAPSLPIVPQHNVNAFLEDYVHDWNMVGKRLRYYSRVAHHSIWVLLEYAA